MARRARAGGGRRIRDRQVDDAGGVWIATGIVLGVLLYGLIVLMYVAGFTEVAPLVILPPVLIGLIGASSLLGGGRGPRRPTGPVGGGEASPVVHRPNDSGPPGAGSPAPGDAPDPA